MSVDIEQRSRILKIKSDILDTPAFQSTESIVEELILALQVVQLDLIYLLLKPKE